MTGTIFDIKEFSLHDGPGGRVTVFLKGCPLNCLWCHNPESKSTQKELFYNFEKCVGCARCAKACNSGCHIFTEDKHIYNRQECITCGKCAEACFVEALETVGETKTVEEVMTEVLKDKDFYDNSGGGITISGGDPMLQFEFTFELLKAAKEKGLHTCIETCGFAKKENIIKIAPLVDIFLFDYKETDSQKHKEFTGVSNESIIENLKMIDSMGCKTVLRCPIIPTLNDTTEHLFGIADIANELENIIEINVEPYHPLGSSKAMFLSKEYPLKELTFPSGEAVEEWINKISSKTKITVKKA